MKFGRFWSLLGPVILVTILYMYSLSVMWSNPSSSLEDRGAGLLLVMAVLTCVVELVAVPAALFRIWRHAEYRILTNFSVLAIGCIPVAICVLLFASIASIGS